MEIITHRGFWNLKKDQNNIKALLKSLDLNYGVEFDVRDFNSNLVLSHDIPNNKSPKLEDFLKKIKNLNKYLVINIKSDGLNIKLKRLLKKYKIKNYAVFDMSIPDTLTYVKLNIKFLLRISKYENDLSLLQKSHGIWLDQFDKNFVSYEKINFYFKLNKKIFIVSPELHGRSYIQNWRLLKNISTKIPNAKIFLCTDFPNKANRFFNDKSYNI